MNVHSASLTGLRKNNEDYHNIITNKNKINNMPKINYFGVYDGHGGDEVSKYLSKELPKYFLYETVSYPLSKSFIRSIFDRIQKNLKHMPYSREMGSTCSIVIQYDKYNKNTKKGDKYINVINTGDCRSIICRDNFGIPLTKDHKPNWPEEKKRIEKLGGKIYYDGFDWRIKDLSVSRAFGDYDATPYVTHRPDIYRYKINKKDKFIVLACDGLWDVLSNQDVINHILNNYYVNNKRIKNEINIAKNLAHYAIRKGSKDNVTVIIIFLD